MFWTGSQKKEKHFNSKFWWISWTTFHFVQATNFKLPRLISWTALLNTTIFVHLFCLPAFCLPTFRGSLHLPRNVPPKSWCAFSTISMQDSTGKLRWVLGFACLFVCLLTIIVLFDTWARTMENVEDYVQNVEQNVRLWLAWAHAWLGECAASCLSQHLTAHKRVRMKIDLKFLTSNLKWNILLNYWIKNSRHSLSSPLSVHLTRLACGRARMGEQVCQLEFDCQLCCRWKCSFTVIFLIIGNMFSDRLFSL